MNSKIGSIKRILSAGILGAILFFSASMTANAQTGHHHNQNRRDVKHHQKMKSAI